jgi:hypothetical protein
VLTDASTGQRPGTLASFAHRNDFSREGGKIVTPRPARVLRAAGVQACLPPGREVEPAPLSEAKAGARVFAFIAGALWS